MIIIINLKLNLLSLVLGCRYYKSLIKHVYQLPTYPCPPNYCFRVQTLVCSKMNPIFFVFLSTKYFTITDRFKTLLSSLLRKKEALLSFIPLAGSHEVFIFHQHLFRLLFVTHFTSLVQCALILI